MIVVTGIGTDVGKTVVSAILTECLDGCYWKPVQSGLPADSSWVEEQLSAKGRVFPSAISLITPCSPHLAARKEGVRIEAKTLTPPKCLRPLIVEGTGGLLVPLNETETWADAAVHWDARWILVHRHYLGSLNHFALTLEAIRQRKLPLCGVIFNGEEDLETEKMLLKKAKVKCLGRLRWQQQLNIKAIAREWSSEIRRAFGIPLPKQKQLLLPSPS